MRTIEGLCVQPNPAELDLSNILRTGTPDVAEAIGVTLEAYRDLGFAPDVDTVTESLTTDFNELAGLGYDGRLYVEPPVSVSFSQIVGTAEARKANGINVPFRYANLWSPGTESNSYTTEDLNGSEPTDPEPRLAVFNADQATGVDPILHFLKMPYDDQYREGAPETQLEALEATKQEFTNKHPKALMQALGHRAAVMLVLMDRIRGVKTVNPKSADFVLNQGFLRIPELGRRCVVGFSYVGVVRSSDSQLALDGGDGHAYSSDGVGVSVGLNELEPQAS